MASPTTDRRLGLAGNAALKVPVTVLAATNITQSGEQTIDGVAVLATNSAGKPDRVLCTGMTDATKNGLWDVNTGAWTRSVDANGNYDLAQGTLVLVNRGTTYAGTCWRITTTGAITIGTTSIAWGQALTSALSSLTFTPTGTGAVARDAQSKMREIVSVFDFMTAAQIADVQARTEALDVSAAWQAAVDATFYPTASNVGGGDLYWPRGTHKFASEVNLPNAPFRIYGEGSASQIKTAGCSAFVYEGQFSTISELCDGYILGNSTAGTEAFRSDPLTLTWVVAQMHFKRLRVGGFPRQFNIPNAQLCEWEECVFNGDANGSIFYVHPTANGQAANSNRVTRCQVTGTNVQTMDYDRGGFSVNCANWVWRGCDFQQSGAVAIPMTIKDVDWVVADCEFENSTAPCQIDIVADDTQQPNNTRLEALVMAGISTEAAIRLRRTGVAQYTYLTTLENINVGANNNLLSINAGGGRATVVKSCGGLIVNEANDPYLIRIGGTAGALVGGLRIATRVKSGRKSLTYNGTIAVDAAVANRFDIDFTGGSAVTIQDPTNPPTVSNTTQRLTFCIKNTSGGALGAITWGAGAYKMAAWTSPATGNSRSITFEWNDTYWVEVSRCAADVPN